MTKSFARLDLRSGNFRDMMALCGAEMQSLAGDPLGLMLGATARVCRFCRRDEDCRRWIQAADPALLNDPPDFCPNRRRFLGARDRLP